MSISARNKRLCGALLLLGPLAGCAVGPDFAAPEPPAESRYAHDGDPSVADAEQTRQQFHLGAELSADWWHLFNSAKLDGMIAEALSRNPGLEAARASLQQSEAELRSGFGIFYPQISGGASATRQRDSGIRSGFDAPPSIFNLFTLSASVSYAVDLFGGNRRLVEELGAQVDFAQANERAAGLTLTANLANTTIARAAYRAQIDDLKGLIALQREQVGIAETQAESGTAPYAAFYALRTQLAGLEASVPALQLKLSQTETLLATLAGHAPAEWKAPDIALADLTLPADLPVSLPSALVRQRPDILAAEAAAHAASAKIGVATAALLPSITLTGSYSANASRTGRIFDGQGALWDFGAGLTTPIFEGGTLWYRRESAKRAYDEAIALYRQTVIGAFGQVADTLEALDLDADSLRAQDRALDDARTTLHLVQANYQAGIATYLDVINADIQLHQAMISQVQAKALRYQDTVALFAALGGGWWSEKS